MESSVYTEESHNMYMKLGQWRIQRGGGGGVQHMRAPSNFWSSMVYHPVLY